MLVDIQTGIKRCAETCPYYGYCGAGAPANKYYENGSFASTQTLYCRYAVQMPLDIVLNDMESGLEPNRLRQRLRGNRREQAWLFCLVALRQHVKLGSFV